jgi:hypothetical protein
MAARERNRQPHGGFCWMNDHLRGHANGLRIARTGGTLGPSLPSGPSSWREGESTIAMPGKPKLRRVAALALALALAGLAAVPLGSASAQCPGCDEYTLDIPNPGGDNSANSSQDPSGGGEDPAAAVPAPAAPAPVPVAPTEPTAPTETPSGEVPATVAPEGSGIRERRGPRLPLTMRTISPHDPVAESAQDAIVSAAVVAAPERGSTLPLLAVMAAIVLAGASLALSRRLAARNGRLPRRVAAR